MAGWVAGWHTDCSKTPMSQNLASKLAHHFKGTAILRLSHPLAAVASSEQAGEQEAELCVHVVDGVDLTLPMRVYRAGKCLNHVVVTLGAPPSVLGATFPGAKVVDLRSLEKDMLATFEAVKRWVQGAAGSWKLRGNGWFIDASPFHPGYKSQAQPAANAAEVPRLRLCSAFLSHAVKDEALLVPVVQRLRELYGAELFLCGDSIPTGSNWQHAIMQGLAGADVFVVLLSAAVKASHFCSYEIGYAMGMRKDVKVGQCGGGCEIVG